MADEKKSSRASRVLRFTVTSALLIAPLGGCGGATSVDNEDHVDTDPVERPLYAPNPGPDEVKPQPQGPRLPPPTPMPTQNPGPQEVEVDSGMHRPLNAPNPGPHIVPTSR